MRTLIKRPNDLNHKMLHSLLRKSEMSHAVSDLTKSIGPIIDMLFISQFIGADGVAAVGYVSPLIVMLELIGSGIASGARAKISPLLGSGKLDDASHLFSGSLIIGGGVSFLAAVLIFIFCPGITAILGAIDPGISEMTMQYIYGYIIGYPFFALIRILTPYLQMEGQFSMVNTSSFLITAIDISADAFVIFALHGGMFEIGLATSIGYLVPFIVIVSFFWRRKKHSAFHFSFKGINASQCFDLIRLGAPAGIVKGSSALGGTFINNILTACNVPYLVAAYSVFSQITVFIRSSWYAPADSLQYFSGVFIGEEDRNSLKEMQKTALIQALIYTSSVTLFLLLFARPIAAFILKTDNAEVLQMSTECIQISALSLPFHSVIYNFSNYLVAVKKLRFSCIYCFLINCGCLVPITWYMVHFLGYHGVWIARIVSKMVVSLIAVIYIYKSKHGIAFSDKMLLLPDSFGVSSENEITVEETTPDEVVRLLDIAINFASTHGADYDRAKTFGLIMEELAIVLAKHCFTDSKPHNINIRLVAKDDDLIIRMRDDCKPFNVKEYYEIINESAERSNELGLPIIMEMPKSIEYTSTFGVNNLIVKV